MMLSAATQRQPRQEPLSHDRAKADKHQPHQSQLIKQRCGGDQPPNLANERSPESAGLADGGGELMASRPTIGCLPGPFTFS